VCSVLCIVHMYTGQDQLSPTRDTLDINERNFFIDDKVNQTSIQKRTETRKNTVSDYLCIHTLLITIINEITQNVFN